jgi:E3 ubiquitin-protein ligase HUWE1
MLSLVSSLAEEMDIFRNSRNQSGGHSAIQNEINNINENLEESKLIDVSDDDDDEDEDDNVETDYESESETDSESDTETVDDVNEPKIVNTQELVSNDNEIITITKLEDLQSNDIVDLVEELNDTEKKYDLDELDELDELDNSLDGSNNLDELDDTNVVEELDDTEEINVVEELDDIEEINDDIIDYNKLSVAKLKEIALEKNLISNTSNKLKKAELLKLLEGI